MQVLKRKKRRLERNIESDVVRHVRVEMNGLARKMNGLGYNSWPDRLILLDGCPELWIEFKRPGEEPTEQQAFIHKQLRAQGREVWVEDDSDKCIAKLNRWYRDMINRGLMRRHGQ